MLFFMSDTNDRRMNLALRRIGWRWRHETIRKSLQHDLKTETNTLKELKRAWWGPTQKNKVYLTKSNSLLFPTVRGPHTLSITQEQFLIQSSLNLLMAEFSFYLQKDIFLSDWLIDFLYSIQIILVKIITLLRISIKKMSLYISSLWIFH